VLVNPPLTSDEIAQPGAAGQDWYYRLGSL